MFDLSQFSCWSFREKQQKVQDIRKNVKDAVVVSDMTANTENLSNWFKHLKNNVQVEVNHRW